MALSHDEACQLRERLRSEALALGFACAGFTTAEPLSEGRQRQWERWRELGLAGAMGYLLRIVPRRTHPRDLLPEARSMLVVMAGYDQGGHPEPTEKLSAKVARYGWGQDYHHVLKDRLNRLGASIEQWAREHGVEAPVTYRACVDSAPLDERAFAVRAGLGFVGKHGVLIHPEKGSWGLLGVLLLSLELPPDEPQREVTASCGSCRRCLEACPTEAIYDAYRLDPRRCLSYLTIEQRDAIPDKFVAKMQGWGFGCDICQEVCPFNAEGGLPLRLSELAATEGCGPYLTQSMLNETPSNKGFLKRWRHTPLARAGRKGIERNLIAATHDDNKDAPA